MTTSTAWILPDLINLIISKPYFWSK